MKYSILLIFLFFINSCFGQDCKLFTEERWHIAYNKYYNKYAVMRIDGSLIGSGEGYEFLVKDHNGEYGIYGAGWESKHCISCGDTSKSLFTNPCDAKKFILEYLRKLKEDKWQ